MSLTQVAVTGTYRYPDGTACAGTVEFIPFTPLQNTTSNIIASGRTTATLSSGALSVTLYATDDSDTDPDGAVYEVTERITGAPERSYLIEIPNTGAVNLADLAPASDMPYTTYATAASVTSTNRTVQALRASEWWLFGHSYAWTYGLPTQRGVQRIAEQCGAIFHNYGVTGAYLLTGGATTGGFATLFHSLSDPAYTYTGANGFPPPQGIVTLQTGYNDLVSYAADETALRTAFKHALRACLSWCHTSSFFQHDEASTGQTFSSTGWTTTTTSDLTPGTSYTTNSNTGRTITVATPTRAAGQVVSLWFVADAVGGSVNASSMTFTRDGTTVTPTGYDSAFSTVDQWPAVATTAGVMVARFAIPDDAASHSFVCTAGAGGVSYAGYSIESPRPVLVHDVARTTAGTVTDALTALINTDIDTVVAESHTDQTKVVEMDTALGKAADVFGDTVHPNVRGHRLIADAVWDALVSLTLEDSEAVYL